MTDSQTRAGGGLLLVMGLAAGYYFAYRPLQQAREHAETVTLSLKLDVFVPFLIIAGVILLIAGQRGRDAMQTQGEGKQRLKPLGWVVAITSVAIGLGLHAWLERTIASYGYQF